MVNTNYSCLSKIIYILVMKQKITIMKKQINKITIGLVFLSLLSLVNAQTIDMTAERTLMSKDASVPVKAEGSPYISDSFMLARISSYGNKIFNARFNAFNNEMEVSIEDNKVIALDNKVDFEVIFTAENKIYRTVTYLDDNATSKRGFLVVLFENDKYSLFKEERITFNEKVEARTSYDKAKPASYNRIDDLYFIKLEDKITFLPQRKKDFLQRFSKHEKELKSYMKNNKLNPKNEDELITLVKHLSTLNQ